MAQSIETVQVDIVASSKGASQMLQLLEKRLEGVQSALKAIDTSTLKSISSASKSLGIDTTGLTKDEQTVKDAVDNIKQSLAGLEAYKKAALGGDTSSLTSFERKAIKLQSEIDSLGAKLEQLDDKRIGMNIDTDPFQSYRTSLALVQADLNKTKSDVTSAVATMNSQKPDIDSGETKNNLEEISASARKAASNILSMAGTGIKNSISSLRSHLSKIKDTLSSIGSSSSKGVTSAFSKILKYGFGIRSLYVLFRRLKQAIKDSFTELQKSGADFQTTKANVEALKNSLTTLKYQFGAAFEPIFNTVAPALQTLINYLVSVMNTLSAFIAKLSGKSTYSKAVVATGEIAKNTGSAAGSAKELNKQLQGFDELNNLSGDSGSGGGGSGGSSSDASNVTYEEASVDSALSSFWNSLVDSIKAGEWEKVGSMISEKLTSALNSIKWDDVFSAASNFGKNFASFLNGLITEDLFSALGTTIGNSIKTALTALNSFGTTFDWSNFGSSIAAGINSFVATNPLSLAVDTFNTWANGILDTLISAIKGISWTTIGQHIADAIGKIDASGIGWKLGTLATSLANALYDLVSNKSTWKNLGQKIADGINGFFEGFEGSKLAKTANAIKDALFDTIKTSVKNIKWSEIGNDINSFLGDLDIGTIALAISGVILASGAASQLLAWATSAILAKLSALTMATLGVSLGTLAINVAGVVIAAGAAFKIGWEFGTTAGEWLAQVMKNAGIISDEANEDYYTIAESMTMMEKINDIKLSVKEGTFADAWTNMWGDWFDPTFAEIESLGVKIKSITLELVDGWNDTNDKIWDPVFELGEDIWEGIKDGFAKAIDWVSPIKDMFDNIVAKIKDKFGINSPAKAMYDYGKYIFKGIIEGFIEAMKSYSFPNLLQELYDYFNTDEVKTGQHSNYTTTDTAEATSKLHNKSVQVKINTKLTGDATSTDDLLDLTSGFKNLTDEASKGATAKFDTDTDTSNVEQSINYGGIAKARSSWKKTTTSKFDTKTDTSVVDESITSGGLFKAIKNWAVTTTSKFDTKPDTSAVEDSMSKGSLKQAKEAWQNTRPVSTFATSANVNDVKNAMAGNGVLTVQKNAWNNTKATATFNTNADVNNVKNAMTGNGALIAQRNAWNNTKATATFNTSPNVNDVNYSRTNSKGSLYQAQQAWKNSSATATFNTKADVSEANYSLNQNQNGCLKKIKEDWQKTTATATFNSKTDLSGIYWQWNAGDSDFNWIWNKWSSATATSTFTVDFSYNQSDMDAFTTNLRKQLKEQLQMTMSVSVSGGQASVHLAKGGSYFGGSWHDIPQYARGGKPGYGSLFMAGEAGPEIVGHLNGRTEVLNKSQIASTIHSAFVSSMAQFGNRMLATPESVAVQSGSYSSYSGFSGDSEQTALMAEQNRLLAEQNQLLMEIAGKDVSISSRDVFNAVKSESKRYNNMTGSSPFLF